jgi:hypothetical protein
LTQLNIVYNKETGEIIKALSSNNYATLAANISASDTYTMLDIEDISNLADYIVVNDALVKKEKLPEQAWAEVRKLRDQYLLACDWTQLPDVPLATKEVWAQYRQSLRDVTLQADPFNITWPEQPQ